MMPAEAMASQQIRKSNYREISVAKGLQTHAHMCKNKKYNNTAQCAAKVYLCNQLLTLSLEQSSVAHAHDVVFALPIHRLDS